LFNNTKYFLFRRPFVIFLPEKLTLVFQSAMFTGIILVWGKTMKIKMHPPLDRIMGPVKEVPGEHPLSLADLLRSLGEEAPGFGPYAGFGPKDVQPYGLLVWRDGKMLNLVDILNPTDELEFIVMIAGG
jgi:hypothetical protein